MKYIAVLFAIISCILCFMYNHSQNKIKILESEKKILYASKLYLENEIGERNKKALESNERVQELARLAEKEKNKGGFDWGSPLPSDAVTLRLFK